MGSCAEIRKPERLVLALLRDTWQDVRYGARMMRKNPGFTAIATLTLALGIGANTAIFSLMSGVMLRFLPVKNPRELVQLRWTTGTHPRNVITSGYSGASFPFPVFEQLRFRSSSFSSVFAFANLGFDKPNISINAGGEPVMGRGEMVSGDYFSGLGVTPMQGRPLAEEDERPGAPLSAVVSYAFWTHRLARSSSAVGSAIKLNGVVFTICGVAPPEFFGLDQGRATDVWIPFLDRPELRPWSSPAPRGESLFLSHRWWWISVMGRLKPGVIPDQARAEVDAQFQAGVAASLNLKPGSSEVPRAELISASRGLNRLRRRYSEPLAVMMVLVCLVLVIACANVAGLSLARASTRRREVGVRLALGGSRSRVVRQLLTESVLIAGAGGAAGLLLAYWFSNALVRLMSSGGTPFVLDVRPDSLILAFTAGVTILTGILFGLAPAIRTTRLDVTSEVKQAGPRGTSGPPRRWNLGKSLVVGQVALSLFLLAAAGLFVRTLRNLRTQDFGFDGDHLLMFGVDPMQAGYSGAKVYDVEAKLLAAIRAIPGARAASTSQLGLITGWQNSGPIYVEGSSSEGARASLALWNAVGSDFFRTVGIRQLLGRSIEPRDLEPAGRVAVVNEALVRRFFGSANPIGRRLNPGETPDPQNAYEIVGVVQSAKFADAHEDAPPTFYVPYTLSPARPGGMYFEVRASRGPAALASAVRAAARQIDPNLTLFDLKTQDAQIEESLMQERLFVRLSGFFAGLATLLVAVGLYGLLAYTATQRFREIGVRMALGALPRDIARLVVGQGIALALAGIAFGSLAAAALTRFLAGLLFGVKPGDPATFIAVAALLLLVALVSCSIPAWRASRTDPMVALRYE